MMLMRLLLIVMMLVSVLLPITIAQTDNQTNCLKCFNDGFYLGQLYNNRAAEYAPLAKMHNDNISSAFGDAGENYLIPTNVTEITDGSETGLMHNPIYMFAPDITAVNEIQINKVLKPIGNVIQIGQ